MKIFKNFLHPDHIDEINNLLEEKLCSQGTQGYTNLGWQPKIVEFSATVYIMPAPELEDFFKTQLAKVIDLKDKVKEIVPQFYVWGRGSYIPMHNDGSHVFGATLYLNKVWRPEDGGLFLHRDKITGELKVIEPERNTLVVNDDHAQHMVTPVSFFSTRNRYTLQIWGNQ